MTKEMICFDVETTGINANVNHIIQLSLIKFDSETFEEIDSRNWYILPKGPFTIEKGAYEVHHLTKEFIQEHGVTLDSVFPELQSFIKGCDMLSYNGNRFDVGFLYHDLEEYGLSLDYDCKYYDAYAIETERNSRKLAAVYKKYTGKDMEGAHDALCDVRATVEVFKHQVNESVEDIENNPFFNVISPEGFVYQYDKDTITFAKGKYKNVPVAEVCKIDPSYIRWLFDNCSNMTKETVKREYYKANALNEKKV